MPWCCFCRPLPPPPVPYLEASETWPRYPAIQRGETAPIKAQVLLKSAATPTLRAHSLGSLEESRKQKTRRRYQLSEKGDPPKSTKANRIESVTPHTVRGGFKLHLHHATATTTIIWPFSPSRTTFAPQRPEQYLKFHLCVWKNCCWWLVLRLWKIANRSSYAQGSDVTRADSDISPCSVPTLPLVTVDTFNFELLLSLLCLPFPLF